MARQIAPHIALDIRRPMSRKERPVGTVQFS